MIKVIFSWLVYNKSNYLNVTLKNIALSKLQNMLVHLLLQLWLIEGTCIIAVNKGWKSTVPCILPPLILSILPVWTLSLENL